MLSLTYRTLTNLGAPFIGLYMLKRRAEGREDKPRFYERFGRASRKRPDGPLIWCHAASVGESASILSLIDKLIEVHPDTHILVTTWTVTSARMLAKRLPPGAFHQYMPVDRTPYIKRFLDYWRPDSMLLIESELWPNMLHEVRARAIPAAIVNGRMSEDSFQRWYRFKTWANELMSSFALCLTQTEDDKGRFVALGAKHVRCLGNLKYAAKPLPADEKEMGRLRLEIGARPLWLMASSHRGEETLAFDVHQKLRKKWPDLLTIIVPRHAVRGPEIARLAEERGLALAQRSKKETIEKDTDIYLADTMGELGLFYRLGRLVVLGGSFVPVGGHNPIEPAQLGCSIVFGPRMQNFSMIAREFVRQQAAIQLKSGDELAATVGQLMNASAERAKLSAAGHALAEEKRHVLDLVLEALTPWFDTAIKKAA